MKKDVYVVYESDQWLTKSEKVAVAVCDNWGDVSIVAEDIMKGYGMKYEEDLDEEDDSTETIERALEEFDNTYQYRGNDFGICVDLFVMNERPYSI
jgi:hypothetical protein